MGLRSYPLEGEDSPKSWVRIPPGPLNLTPHWGRVLAFFGQWGSKNAAFSLRRVSVLYIHLLLPIHGPVLWVRSMGRAPISQRKIVSVLADGSVLSSREIGKATGRVLTGRACPN